MDSATNTTTSGLDIVTMTTAELQPPPRFHNITFVKIAVLALMFFVSFTANSAVLVCVVRRWRRRRLGQQVVLA